ncbi:hypothetical protein [Hymenobacter sp. BT190]|uniref:hypothetical protein n=1 Tax=Hymenobacter sp. BT190 TaxID=2763505 RepID=UPI001650E20D|nr:hypothetical protein [Hymenobacter sp. BT190]MBC6700154.1 hypothetical protein [Hymenobacter sp. BT190]
MMLSKNYGKALSTNLPVQGRRFVSLAASKAEDFVERATGPNLEVNDELAGGLLTRFVEFLDGRRYFLDKLRFGLAAGVILKPFMNRLNSGF